MAMVAALGIAGMVAIVASTVWTRLGRLSSESQD